MLLVGVNRSPFTRRVAITLNSYGVPFEQRALSGFDNRAEVRASNPLGRIPALVLGSGETLIDSNAIIDHLDEAYGGDRPLTPRSGAERRAVLKVAAMMMGACEKCLHAAYERNRRPPEKLHQPDRRLHGPGQKRAGGGRCDDRSGKTYLFERLTQADVTAVVTERPRVGSVIPTPTPHLRALTKRLAEAPFFQ